MSATYCRRRIPATIGVQKEHPVDVQLWNPINSIDQESSRIQMESKIYDTAFVCPLLIDKDCHQKWKNLN